MDNIVQQKLKELDSVIWNGLFLKYSDFKKNVYSIFENTSDHIIVIVQIGNHFELYTVNNGTEVINGGENRVVCIITVKDGYVFVS